jgi:glycosyltransferase involved in cell wall biosynthesis
MDTDKTLKNAERLPLVSLILPAYNEASILKESIETIYRYLQSLVHRYRWEILLINDGSKDDTGKIAEELAIQYPIIRVFHHIINLNLGTALKTGFNNSKGDYVVTMDLDLSYSVDHIEMLLSTIETTQADMVLASPYMKGGKVTSVYFLRRIMSKWLNWLMSLSSQEKYHTFTCMVRAYKGNFIRSLNLKTKNYEINPEIIFKAMILRARIIEIPAHLDWSFQNKFRKTRDNGLNISKGIFSGLMASFVFRPYIYFLGVGSFLMLIFLYMLTWIFINVFRTYSIVVSNSKYFDDRFSSAIATVYNARPYAFFIAGITLIVAFQLFSIGFLSLQSKRYFDELFHLGSSKKRDF